jgi:RimJ/RimL family protein N-acetyltransferase
LRLAPAYPIVTQRLQLRPLALTDVDALYAYRSLGEVCRYIPPVPLDHAALADRVQNRWARTTISDAGESIILGIELTETEQVIGDLMLFFTSAEHRTGELGWVIDPRYSGRGYATEAAHALMHLAFDDLGLHRVVARIDARNDASLRLGDRLGMRREAHLVANEWFKGDWSDEIDMALLETEWASQHADGPQSCHWPLTA